MQTQSIPTTRPPMAVPHRSYNRADLVKFGVACAVGGAAAASIAAAALIALAYSAAHLLF